MRQRRYIQPGQVVTIVLLLALLVAFPLFKARCAGSVGALFQALDRAPRDGGADGF